MVRNDSVKNREWSPHDREQIMRAVNFLCSSVSFAKSGDKNNSFSMHSSEITQQTVFLHFPSPKTKNDWLKELPNRLRSLPISSILFKINSLIDPENPWAQLVPAVDEDTDYFKFPLELFSFPPFFVFF